jgi:hypothetical protein
MTNSQNLKKEIMRRVYFIFAIRKLITPFNLEIAGLAFLSAAIVAEVSIKHVLMNMPRLTDLPQVYQFSVSAFINTRFITQVAVVAMLALSIIFVREAVKKLIDYSHRLQTGY